MAVESEDGKLPPLSKRDRIFLVLLMIGVVIVNGIVLLTHLQHRPDAAAPTPSTQQ